MKLQAQLDLIFKNPVPFPPFNSHRLFSNNATVVKITLRFFLWETFFLSYNSILSGFEKSVRDPNFYGSYFYFFAWFSVISSRKWSKKGRTASGKSIFINFRLNIKWFLCDPPGNIGKRAPNWTSKSTDAHNQKPICYSSGLLIIKFSLLKPSGFWAGL